MTSARGASARASSHGGRGWEGGTAESASDTLSLLWVVCRGPGNPGSTHLCQLLSVPPGDTPGDTQGGAESLLPGENMKVFSDLKATHTIYSEVT